MSFEETALFVQLLAVLATLLPVELPAADEFELLAVGVSGPLVALVAAAVATAVTEELLVGVSAPLAGLAADAPALLVELAALEGSELRMKL